MKNIELRCLERRTVMAVPLGFPTVEGRKDDVSQPIEVESQFNNV